MRKLKLMLATIMALVVMAAMSVPAMATGNGNGHYCKHHCGGYQPPDNTNTNGQGQVQYQFVIINKKGHKHHKRGGHGGRNHR